MRVDLNTFSLKSTVDFIYLETILYVVCYYTSCTYGDAGFQMNRRERKKEAIRLHVIEEAMRLFRQQGFDSTTMEQVASQADVSKATLYKYFSVKEAIVAGYWKSSVSQKTDLLPQLFASISDTKGRILAVFLSAGTTFKSEPEFAYIQLKYQLQKFGEQPLNGDARSGFEGFLEKLLEQGQKQRDIRGDILVSDMASQLLFLFTSTCLIWFSNPNIFPLEKRLNQTVDIFFEGAQYA